MTARSNVLWLGRAANGGWVTSAKRYGLALILTLGMLLLRQSLSSNLQNTMLFAFSSIAIALSAGLCGLGPGLFATALSALWTLYWFIEPRGSFAITNIQGLGQVLSFLIIGGLLTLIIEALHRSRRQRGEQAEQFRSLFEQASIGKALVDPATGRFVLVNCKFSEIIGYSEQELLGMTFRQLTYPEDREKSEECFGRLVRGEIAEYATQRRHVRADGRLIWVELLITLTRAADGQPRYALGSILDITRRKQVEEALRESEERYRQVIRSAGNAIIGVDMSGRITMYNGQAQQIFGYTEQEVLGRHVVGTIVPPTDAEGRDMRPYIPDMLRHSEKYLYNENENLAKDGRRLWMAWTNRPILEPGGTLRQIVCMGLDLTERKRTEEALRLSEERFRATYEHAPVGIEQVGLDGRLLAVNDAICHMLGYAREELLGKTFIELTHPDDREAEAKLLQQLFMGETASYQVEKRDLRKGGEPIWVRVTSSITHQPHSYRISIIEDITAQKEAEALFHERSFLRQVIDAAPSMISVKDWQGRFILANEALARCYGTSVEEVMGKTDADFNPNSGEVERFWRDDHAVMSERREMLIPAEQVTFRSGEVHWYSSIKVPLLNNDGSCDKVLVVASDITERKQAEEALRESEQREQNRAAELQAILEAVPAAIWVARDPQCEHITGNQMAYEMLRLPWGANLSKSALEDQRPTHFKVLKDGVELRAEQLPVQLAASGIEVRGFEEQLVFDDGSVHHLLGNATPLRDEQGRPWGAVGAFVDVTEHRATEQALRQSEERLGLAVEFAEVGIWDADFLTGTVFCSPQIFALVGQEPTPNGRMPVDRIWQSVHPDDRISQQEEYQKALELHHDYHIECRIIRADDGRVRWIMGLGRFIMDGTGQAVRALGLILDITDRKRMEEDLRAANGQLQETNQRKDEFLAMLAHELRNPLAPIRNAIQVLRMIGSHEPAAVRQQDIIDRQVSHMARLLEDLLDVSRITRGMVALQKRTLDLTDVLAHAMEVTTPLIEARRHTLHLALPSEELRVEGDIDRLAQVVGNLLANAAKYTDEGGQIWLEGRKELDQAVVSVRDSGLGIAPEMLPHVFELFAQADKSLARSRGGLGIGLTMVHKLVKMHGGTVEARSEGLDKGSEFIVRLPALPPIPQDHEKTQNPTARDEAGHPEVCRPRRVLVVDDILDSASSLSDLLQMWGHEARMALDGQSALTAAHEFHPEIVLLDIGRPVMDGYEVARRLRAEHGSGMILVALTGYGQSQDYETAHAAGFDHHLIKPVDIKALRDLLAKALVAHN